MGGVHVTRTVVGEVVPVLNWRSEIYISSSEDFEEKC
jgi:hypothetical protein